MSDHLLLKTMKASLLAVLGLLLSDLAAQQMTLVEQGG